jgi:phage tail sheath protein FI
MMFVAEKRIRKGSRYLLFEPHDELFHTQFISMASKILDEIKVGRGLTAYRIQADWELNTPDRVDRNEFWARIGIQPTKAVEFMFIEFSIHRTGSWDANAEVF